MPHGKICYLEIPANRAEDSARFYSDIFGWKVRERGDGNLAFDDTGGVSGTWVKESDRITAIVANLRAIGADAEELPDGFVVRGSDRPLVGRVVTHGDHRIAMAFGVLGALRGNDIEIDDPSCAAVSYPTFWDDLERVRKR